MTKPAVAPSIVHCELIEGYWIAEWMEPSPPPLRSMQWVHVKSAVRQEIIDWFIEGKP